MTSPTLRRGAFTNRMAGGVVARDATVVGRLVQDGVQPVGVARDEHRRVARLERRRVDDRQPALVERHAQVLEPEVGERGAAAGRDEHALEDLGPPPAVGTREHDLDPGVPSRHPLEPVIEVQVELGAQRRGGRGDHLRIGERPHVAPDAEEGRPHP